MQQSQLTEAPNVDQHLNLQRLDLDNNRLKSLPDSILMLPRNCTVKAENNLFPPEYIRYFQQRLEQVRADDPTRGPTVYMSTRFDSLIEYIKKDPDLLKTQNERGQTLFHELVEEQARNPESTNIQNLESMLSILNTSDQADLLNKQDTQGKTALHYAAEGNHEILTEYLLKKCFAVGIGSRCIFEKRDAMGNAPFSIRLREKKENMRTRKWQLGADQKLSKWLHKNNHTNKFALMIYPECDQNRAMEIMGKSKEYLLSVSDHFNLLAVKVGCTEEAISALHEQGNKISLLHIEGHGPGLGKKKAGPGYILPSRVKFGDPKSKKAGRTPLLAVGNQAWIEALIETMEVGGTIIFTSCALGRPEPADQSLPQEIASKLKGKDITVIASSVNVTNTTFSYDPQAPERVRFYLNSTLEQDSTVVY